MAVTWTDAEKRALIEHAAQYTDARRINWSAYDDGNPAHTSEVCKSHWYKFRKDLYQAGHLKTKPKQATPDDILAAWERCIAERDERRDERARSEGEGKGDGVSGGNGYVAPRHKAEFSDQGMTGEAESNSTRIKTLDQLLEACEVDLDEWEVERHVINKWEVGAKDPDSGEIIVEPLFQVKAWLRRRVEVHAMRDLFEDIKEYLGTHAIRYPSFRRPRAPRNEGYLLEIIIPDLHLGLFTESDVTGYEYTLETAKQLYLEATEYFLGIACDNFPIARILHPIGNDFFNVDNASNMTANGTPQVEQTVRRVTWRWGKETIVESADMCLTKAPTELLPVLGNHDPDTLEGFSDMLASWYRSAGDLTVHTPRLRQYVQFGKNLIGFTHGNEEKRDELPHLMRSEQRKLVSDCVWFEWHTGHLHGKKEYRYMPFDEIGGTRVRVIPALVPPSYWAYKKGYTMNVRSAEAIVWKSDGGYAAQYEFPILLERSEALEAISL